jgi:hypothetical protein
LISILIIIFVLFVGKVDGVGIFDAPTRSGDVRIRIWA